MTTEPVTLHYASSVGHPSRPKPSLLPRLCIISLTLIMLVEAILIFAPASIPYRFSSSPVELIFMGGLVIAGMSIGLSAVLYYTKVERILLFTLGIISLFVALVGAVMPQFS